MHQVMVILRDAVEADEVAMLALIKAAFEEQRGIIDPPSSALDKTVAILHQELTTASALVAEIKSATKPALGGCIFYEQKQDAVYLSRLAVPPSYRGRGIGIALIQAAEERGKAMGLRAATLSVRLALLGQQAYYEKLGYRFVGYGTHEGFAKPTFIKMEKGL